MKFGRIVALTGLASMLTGCMTTQNHDLADVSRVHKKSAKVLQETAASTRDMKDFLTAEGLTDTYKMNYSSTNQNYGIATNAPVNQNYTNQNNLTYLESRELAKTYAGILPSLNANLHFSTHQETTDTNGVKTTTYSFDSRAFNSTGPLNAYLDEVKMVQNIVGDKNRGYTFLDIGSADGDFASARSPGNQFSRSKGIFGIEYLSNNLTNKFANYAAHESPNGDVTIAFGFAKPNFEGKLSRNFTPDLGNIGLEAGTAYGVLRALINKDAGLAGGAGVLAAESLDVIVGYFEGRRAPRETMMVQGRKNINVGLEEDVATTLEVFRKARYLGARDVAFFNDKDGGVGIVYGNGFKKVRTDGDILTVVIDGDNSFNLKAMGLAVAKGAAAAGAGYGVYEWKFNGGNGSGQNPGTQTGSGGRTGEGPSVTNPGQGNNGTNPQPPRGSGGRIGEGISVRGN